MGSDFRVLAVSYFNPHSPCGERPVPTSVMTFALVFQSTLPLRGATQRQQRQNHERYISIHTPLAGSDAFDARNVASHAISIHTPLAGSDG